MTNQFPDEMRTRLRPGAVPAAQITATEVKPPFVIVIPAADGTELLRMTERNGRLHVTGDEFRWTEGAARFVHAMMQWSGQVGLRWREEAVRAVEG